MLRPSRWHIPTPRAEEWHFQSDGFGREVRVERRLLDPVTGDFLESAVTEQAYDGRGRLVRTSSPEGTIHYRYDDLDRRIRTFTGTPDAVLHDWRYSYDAFGRLREIVMLRRNGTLIDTNDFIAGDQPEVTTYHYELAGNLDWQEHSNATTVVYTYDGLGRLDTVTHYTPHTPFFGGVPSRPDEGQRFAEFDYELRADGRRIGPTESIFQPLLDTVIPGQENTYEWTYDALGRLIDEVFSTNVDDILGAGAVPQGTRPLDDYTDHLIYDLAGNLLQKTTDRDGTIDETVTVSVNPNYYAVGEPEVLRTQGTRNRRFLDLKKSRAGLFQIFVVSSLGVDGRLSRRQLRSTPQTLPHRGQRLLRTIGNVSRFAVATGRPVP